jgi:hypothetical protein
VFLFTTLFRKYFYISFKNEKNLEKKVEQTYTQKVNNLNNSSIKVEEVKTETFTVNTPKSTSNFDDTSF